MTPGGNLSFAVSHAETVEALERCAPEVTATYLQAAYDRMKLCDKYRIRIDYDDGNAMWWVVSDTRPDDFGDCYSESEAARSYFSLIRSLPQSAALPTLADDADTQRVGTAGTAPPVSATSSDPGSPTPAILPGSDPATSTVRAPDAAPVSFFPEGAR
jgi:hypothetical protein